MEIPVEFKTHNGTEGVSVYLCAFLKENA